MTKDEIRIVVGLLTVCYVTTERNRPRGSCQSFLSFQESLDRNDRSKHKRTIIMFKLVQFLLMCCVGFIVGVKEIPGINDKVDNAIASNETLTTMLLDRQAERREKRAEKIDTLIKHVIKCVMNPRQKEYYEDDNNDFGYISAYDCYLDAVENSVYGYHYPHLKGIFDFGDIVEIMEMLTKKKFLTKLQPRYFKSIGLNGKKGPYFKLSENFNDF